MTGKAWPDGSPRFEALDRDEFRAAVESFQYAPTIAKTETPDDVDRALYEANVAATKAREWTEERNRAITAAIDAGATQRTVAEATGLTHVAVAKIAKRST